MPKHYMDEGWLTLPLLPNSKIPATEHGWKDGELGYDIPAHYNVGVVCGADSGIVVLDVDPRNGGDESWYELIEEFPYLTDTYTVATPSGGWHAYFRYPEFDPERRIRAEPFPGIDFKYTGYVVAPPSTIDGREYIHIRGETFGELGTDFLERCYRARYEPPAEQSGPIGNRPGDWFNRMVPWEDVLVPHGWTRTDYVEEGTEVWARPGREGGRSATVGYEEVDVLHIFTSSTEFESGVNYNKFAAFAVLNFGGDFSEAAAYIADNLMDEPEVVMNEPGTIREWVPPARVYNYDNPFNNDSFMGRYIAFGDKQTDAAEHYHEASGLVALALATPYAIGHLAHQSLGTNLYLLLVGTTTRSRKSTSQRILTDLADMVLAGSRLGNRNTTEALIGDLTRRSGRGVLWAPDEFGVTLAEIRTRDFLKGLEELMLTLYAGDDYVYVKADDRIVVRDPHLNVLGAATPESIARGGPNMMYGGLLPRFGIVFPEALREPRPAGNAPDLTDDLSWFKERLLAIVEHSQTNPDVTWDSNALRILNAEEQNYTQAGMHAQRLPVMLYKVSMLLALSDLRNQVTAADAAQALEVVRHWKQGADHLLPYLRQKSGDLEFQRMLDIIMDELQDGPMFRHSLARMVNTDRAGLDRIQATLVDRSLIEVEVDESSAKPYWRLVS